MKFLSVSSVLLLGFIVKPNCQGQSPFTVSPSVNSNNSSLTLHFAIPANHHLYADRLSFKWAGDSSATPLALPTPESVLDKFSGETKLGFERSFDATVPLSGSLEKARAFAVKFQGCDETQCYFPETHTFALAEGKVSEVLDTEPATSVASSSSDNSWRSLAGNFKVAARGTGYMGSKDFVSFLNASKSGGASKSSDALSFFEKWGWLATTGLILLGGIGLNLTPCILPLIPINLAIIGAGGKNTNRRRGFALGATYGLGMAAAYGALGLIVVLTGSKFGTLNSSPWFNIAIAAIFVVLAFSMFDKLSIDFSRFQSRFRPAGGASGKSRGSFVLALTMGAVAALLAGACVAPVVISALLLSANLYSHGAWLGLALPFCLGLGMALPWPIAGAGLALLPKPGAWMTKVKYGFGVFIALFALYYGHIAYTLFQNVSVAARETSNVQESASGKSASTGNLLAALEQSQKDGKPVFVDFWASWCKNCSAMEHTTFGDAQVQKQLASMHEVRFQAERPNEQPAREVLDYFGAMGLPTYVVLAPAQVADAKRALSN